MDKSTLTTIALSVTAIIVGTALYEFWAKPMIEQWRNGGVDPAVKKANDTSPWYEIWD